MNLTKLFPIQKKLDERIVKEKGLEGQDLLPEKILALQVELGELANEWRGFKFWSEDRNPRDIVFTSTNKANGEYFLCGMCGGEFEPIEADEEDYICDTCFNPLIGMKRRNPLLEEYVDCLHFILSIGNDLRATYTEKVILKYEKWNTTNLFNAMYYQLAMFENEVHNNQSMFNQLNGYKLVFNVFLSIGVRLGFTWDQIEQAYYDKNQINHARQENGY